MAHNELKFLGKTFLAGSCGKPACRRLVGEAIIGGGGKPVLQEHLWFWCDLHHTLPLTEAWRSPQFRLPITGGKQKSAQRDLPMDEPLLVEPQARSRRGKRRSA
jgi:hypothetical protein